MDYTSSSVDGNGIVSKSRKHNVILLTSFATCQGGRPSNALRIDVIKNHTHKEFDLIISIVCYRVVFWFGNQPELLLLQVCYSDNMVEKLPLCGGAESVELITLGL